MPLRRFIAFISLLLVTVPAFGQAVVLRPQDVLPRLKEAAPEAFYINGHDVHGMTDEMAQTYYPLGDSAKYVLALITLRLADKGVIDLDEPVAKALPDLLDFNPFEVAITPRHLMAETAGFAKPVTNFFAAPLQYGLIKVRGAGQISVHDPVGWWLLRSFVERRTGKAVEALIAEELLKPLNIPKQAWMPRHTREPRIPEAPFADGLLRGDALAALSRLLIANEDSSGAAFLSPATHDLLVTKPAWQMHPLGIAALAGAKQMQRGNQQWVEIGGCDDGMFAMAFAQAGVVYVKPTTEGQDPAVCDSRRFQKTVLANAAAYIPIYWDRQQATQQAQQLAEPEVLGGRYQCADVSAWVKDRVEGSESCSLTAHAGDPGTLKVDTNWPSGAAAGARAPISQVYKHEAPYAYKGALGEQPLIFSPYKAGGYAYIGDRAYVRVGVLGYFRTIAGKYLPLMIVILLTGALHIRSKTSLQWRRYGWLATAGALLVGFGLYADWHWWPTVLYDMQMPWLIILWRTGLNIGLMMLLALPMLSLTFVRQQNMPQSGFALLFAGPHLGLISLAAIGLFLTTIIWGVAGTFSAY